MRAISETVTTAFVSSIISTPFRHKSDTTQAAICQVLPAEGGELPAALVVLHDQARPQQKRFCYLGNRAWRQAQAGGYDVEPGIALGKNLDVCLLHRSQAQGVDALQLASLLQVSQGDRVLAFRAADSTTGLKQAQGQPRCAA